MLLGKYLNKYYLRYALLFIIGIISLIAVDYFQLFIPQYLGELVDLFDANLNVDLSAVSKYVPKILIVAFVMFLGRLIWRLTIFNASQKIEANLRHEMYKKSERLSQRYYHENKVGTVMSWFSSDLERIDEYLGWGTIMLIDAFFMSLLVIFKMIKLNLVLSLIMLVPILLIVLWGALVEKYMSEMWDKSQREYDKLFDYSSENFTGIRVIKAFVKETIKIKAFAKVAKENKEANLRIAKFSILFDVMISLIIALITAILLGLGGFFAYHFISGNPVVIFGLKVNLSAGELVTFYGFFDTLIWPMMALGQIVTMRSKAKTSLNRISNFLDQEEEIIDLPNSIELDDYKGEIEFRNFSFAYPGNNKKVLKDISLKINQGEIIGVVGKIGSGKTSLVNSLLRLYNVEENSIFIDGQDLMHLKIKNVREAISYVPQDNFLFSDSLENNIAFSSENVDSKKVEEASIFADVDSNIKEFKDGYKTISGERGVSLSGGQKQRLAISRAYYKNAPIMILDDSVSAVDVKTEETILNNIRNYRKGKTTILVASRVSTVMHLDRIIVLKDGKLEAFDNHENLIKISPTYSKMVELQRLEKEVEGDE